MNKTVIFDFFGVFCHDMTLEWLKKNVNDWESLLPRFLALCSKSDYGTISRTGFNFEIARLTGIPVEQVAQGIKNEAVINNPLVEYTRKLKKNGYKTACLSNGTHEWTTQVITDYHLHDLFDEIILSGDLGIVKPDPRIYAKTLKILGIDTTKAIFVDDRKVNINAAESCGIQSLLFTDTQKIIKDFEVLGIKV